FKAIMSYKDPELLRLTATAKRALLEFGVDDPKKHVIVIEKKPGHGLIDYGIVLVQKTPFSKNEVDTIMDEVGLSSRLIVKYAPGYRQTSEYVKVLSNEDYDLEYSIKNLQDITPTTDDRPFFYDFSVDHSFVTGSVRMQLLLVMPLLVLVLIKRVWIDKKIIDLKWSAYFLLIGLGYMLVEAGLIQKLNIFIGNPIYSISLVLFSLMLCGGVGSVLCARLKRMEFLGMLLFFTLYLLVLSMRLQEVLDIMATAGTLVKLMFTMIILAPASLVMGMFLPRGLDKIRVASAEADNLQITNSEHSCNREMPFYWCINLISSTASISLAMVISVQYGFQATLIGGWCVYMLTSLIYFIKK
ncbi:MAG: hypothetical protein KKD39_03845, partial [Candidatus Altiarchaeota archaeon]|nr:hypothetical protein [Candidatus Altiarchaeota archaeon]